VEDVFRSRAQLWDEFNARSPALAARARILKFRADVDGGNIGYHASGKLPIRREYSGDTQSMGAGNSSGNFDLFHSRNCSRVELPDGFVVLPTRPFPAISVSRQRGLRFPYRSRQILDMLRMSGDKLKPEDSLLVSRKDVYSGFDKFLARQLAAALPTA